MFISCYKRFMNFETSPNNPTFNISTSIPTRAVHVLQFSQTTHKHTQSPTHLGHCFSPLTPIFSRKVHHLSLRRAGASCTKFRHLQQRSVASTHSQRWAVTKILFIVLFAVIRFSRRRRRRLEFTEASMVPSSHAQGVCSEQRAASGNELWLVHTVGRTKIITWRLSFLYYPSNKVAFLSFVPIL